MGQAGVSLRYVVNKFCVHPVKPVYFFSHRMYEAANGGVVASVIEQEHA
jgi:hypothetical protein